MATSRTTYRHTVHAPATNAALAALRGARACQRRTLVVAAHPDDETIGAGATLATLHDVFVVHVTDGAPADLRDAHALGFRTRAEYASARRGERTRALALAGIGSDRVHDLGVTDQMASFALAPLSRALAELIAQIAPGTVITHAYEGGHPDHDATAFATHEALARLAAAGRPRPVLLEMTSYHAALGSDERSTGDFLPSSTATVSVPLTDDARTRKRRMYACYETQRRVLADIPIVDERFRVAPAYDFTGPPHAGMLWYERFDWGVSGRGWRALASAAARELHAAPRCAPHPEQRT